MPDVTVRVCADWYACPLWIGSETPGSQPGLESLGLTGELVSDFKIWNDRWMELADSDEDDADWSTSDEVIRWNERGRELANRLRDELGSNCDVFYYDYITDTDVRF